MSVKIIGSEVVVDNEIGKVTQGLGFDLLPVEGQALAAARMRILKL